MLYTNAIGKLDSKATISVFGANYGNPGTGYFKLCTISNCPDRKWSYTSKDVSAIVVEMEQDGWSCVVSKDGYNAPRIDCTHKDTQSAIDDKVKKSNDKFINAKRGYIRFGACPKSGTSVNHRDNIPEDGVSVFEAEFIGKEHRLIFNNHILESSYLSVSDRPAYRIYGEEVGVGADGEPLLKVTKSVKL